MFVACESSSLAASLPAPKNLWPSSPKTPGSSTRATFPKPSNSSPVSRRPRIENFSASLPPKGEIPPTAVGGWFKSNLQKRYQIASLIPPTGSWWILQIQPRCRAAAAEIRRDLNNPPTAVGGIRLLRQNFSDYG